MTRTREPETRSDRRRLEDGLAKEACFTLKLSPLLEVRQQHCKHHLGCGVLLHVVPDAHGHLQILYVRLICGRHLWSKKSVAKEAQAKSLGCTQNRVGGS